MFWNMLNWFWLLVWFPLQSVVASWSITGREPRPIEAGQFCALKNESQVVTNNSKHAGKRANPNVKVWWLSSIVSQLGFNMLFKTRPYQSIHAKSTPKLRQDNLASADSSLPGEIRRSCYWRSQSFEFETIAVKFQTFETQDFTLESLGWLAASSKFEKIQANSDIKRRGIKWNWKLKVPRNFRLT